MTSTGQPDWHSLEQDQVLKLPDADTGGLGEAEAARRLETYGSKRLPEPPRRHAVARFLLQFHNILIYVLLGAAVIRDGQRHTIDGDELVPGDIALIEAGEKVPADLRLLRVRGLQIQESIQTGESVAAEKRVAPVDVDAALGDRACMAFSGTTVTSGQGQGVIVATGDATQIGLISGLHGSRP